MSPSQNKDILVGIVGVGLVGGELVKQILSINKAKNPFRIVLLASSRKALYTSPENAITDSESWKATLNASEESAELTKFGDYLAGLVAQGKGRKAVIVDNTSSEDVARLYPKWIAQGLNVATPNKKAFSGEKKTWDAILAASDSEGGGRWLNESTVGAGLPVINTLKEMLGSGDRVKKIEGVFSGTMSYIFNNFSAASSDAPKPAFSEVVKVAREKGYTEPHPADDLNGFDVARKLTILARTVSAFSHSQTKLPELESFLDVQTQSLIPAPLEGVASGDEFVGKLPAFDEEFNKLREEAAKEGQVLRFVGVVDVEAGVVKAGLEKYVVPFLELELYLTPYKKVSCNTPLCHLSWRFGQHHYVPY